MFKMCLYLLKQNENKLLGLAFEDILNLINEQPKLILSANCEELDVIEDKLKEEDQDAPKDEALDKKRAIRTIYSRFKK